MPARGDQLHEDPYDLVLIGFAPDGVAMVGGINDAPRHRRKDQRPALVQQDHWEIEPKGGRDEAREEAPAGSTRRSEPRESCDDRISGDREPDAHPGAPRRAAPRPDAPRLRARSVRSDRPQTRRSPRRSPGGSPSPSSAVRDGHPQPLITAVIPPGPVNSRSNETDSMTTTWLPGQVSVDRGVTVKLPVV